jgi:uncharacterized protein (DUF488 family)
MVPRLWTVGHSTRSLGDFLGLLMAHDIEIVADVRRYPGSRRWPHFSREPLTEGLAGRGIGYEAFPELGGRRQPRPDSPNTAWRSTAFRGYADYMATEEFAEGLARLVDLGCGLRTVIMCAEAVWWRCHRGLIADALCWAGFDVHHIMGPVSSIPHPYTSAARITDGLLSYAAPGAA